MSETLSYYTGLITSQYQNSAKFLEWLAAILNILHDASTATDSIDPAFDLDNAVGAQLDVIGAIVGQGRTVDFQPTDGTSPVLDDVTYRTLLKAKIGINQWSGQIADIESLWAILFPGGMICVQDNQDMTLDVAVSGLDLTVIMRDLIKNGYVVPRPQGVLMNFMFGRELPFFGYNLDNDYISGYESWWAQGEGEPPIFAYDMNTAAFKGLDEGRWS